MKIDQKA